MPATGRTRDFGMSEQSTSQQDLDQLADVYPIVKGS